MPLTLSIRSAIFLLIAGLGMGSATQPSAEQQWWSRHDVIGEVVDLQVGERPIRALHREPQIPQVRGAVLMLHPPGGSADGTVITRPLRLGLSDGGWETLTVQLPKRFPSESAQQWLNRHALLADTIASASAWLSARGQPKPVIIGIGASGSAALAFAASASPDALQALVLISTPVAAGSVALQQLSELTLPVLSVVAERDRRAVLDGAALTRAATIDNNAFEQRVILGADDRYAGTDAAVVAAIRAWLAANAK